MAVISAFARITGKYSKFGPMNINIVFDSAIPVGRIGIQFTTLKWREIWTNEHRFSIYQ
jgi:hypothetical protein